MKFIDYIVLFLLIGLAMLMASCTKQVEPCTKQSPTEGVICTKIYQPVIAPDGTIYSNSCMAEADGWENGCLELVNNI